MPLVLLIIYGVPLYSIGLFWLKIEVIVNRDDQGQGISIDYSEANNVILYNLLIYIKIKNLIN
jgi:hypothetical protein